MSRTKSPSPIYGQADHYARKAHAEGYRARSVYKLKEIEHKFTLLHHVRRILDLGAAPGSWAQYCLQYITHLETYVAVDVLPLQITQQDHIHPTLTYIQGDFTTEELAHTIHTRGPYDCILSDAAPNTSGIKALDAMRSLSLAESVALYSHTALSTGGTMVIKLFESSDETRFIHKLRTLFQRVHVYKPQASRTISRERYLVCLKKTST